MLSPRKIRPAPGLSRRVPGRAPHRSGSEGAASRNLSCLLDELRAALLALQQEMAAWRGAEDHKQALIDKLHAELQAHKRGLVQELIKPYLMTLIQMHDSLGRMAEHLRLEPEHPRSSEESADLIRSVQEDLELAMAQQGLLPFSEPGEAFVPARQTSLGVTPTEEAAKAGQIALRLRPGFEQGGDLICKERVRVFALKPQAKA